MKKILLTTFGLLALTFLSQRSFAQSASTRQDSFSAQEHANGNGARPMAANTTKTTSAPQPTNSNGEGQRKREGWRVVMTTGEKWYQVSIKLEY